MTSFRQCHVSFLDVKRVRANGAGRFYAISGVRRRITTAAIVAGKATYTGESAALTANPRDLAVNGGNLYILTAKGVQVATDAVTPVLGAFYTFDPGDGTWIYTTGTYGIVPIAHGGLRVILLATGATVSELYGVVKDSSYADFSSAGLGLLYVVDKTTGTLAVVRVTAGILSLVRTIAAPDCRDVRRVVANDAYGRVLVLCRRRIVTFTVPTAVTTDDAFTVALSTLSGQTTDDLTDIAVTAADNYWVGRNKANATYALQDYLGAQYGLVDRTQLVARLVVGAPDVAGLATSDSTPYYAGSALGNLATGGAVTGTLVTTLAAVRTNGTVLDGVVVGTLLYVIGSFTTVTDTSGTVSRGNAACLDLATGLWATWNPQLSSAGRRILSDGTYIYLGGGFATVNGGTAKAYLARVDPTSALAQAWAPAPSGPITAMFRDVANAKLYVAGNTAALHLRYSLPAATLDAYTPADPNGTVTINVMIDVSATIYAIGGHFKSANVYEELIFIDKSSGGKTFLPSPSGVNYDVTGTINDMFLTGTTIYAGFNGTDVGSQPSFSGTSRFGSAAAFDTGSNLTSWDPTGASATAGTNCVALEPVSGDIFISADAGYSSLGNLLRYTSGGVRVSAFAATFTGGGASKLISYLGGLIALGTFTTVNGTTRTGIAALDPATGALL